MCSLCNYRTRDESCAKGEVLQSPALEYGLLDLDKSVESVRAEKRGKEIPQEEDMGSVEIKKEELSSNPSAQVITDYDHSHSVSVI